MVYNSACFTLQKRLFCKAKQALLRCKTGTIALQNRHYCVAKQALLQNHNVGITLS